MVFDKKEIEENVMKETKKDRNFMQKLAEFIVNKRHLFFLIYGIAVVFCVFSMGWVQVEEDEYRTNFELQACRPHSYWTRSRDAVHSFYHHLIKGGLKK